MRSFWIAAEEEPDRVALIEPDGRAIRAGALAASVNRLVHGLRKRGVGEGSVLAVLQPNGAPLVELLLAAMQAGWHYTPINVHLRPGEVAHILRDSRADAFFGHERYRGPVRRGGRRGRRAGAARRFAVGDVPGSEPIDALRSGQPDARPRSAARGSVHAVHLGHDGPPEGGAPRDPRADPDRMMAMLATNLYRYDIEPGGDRRAPRHVADVPHGAARRSATSRCTSSTRSC